MAPETTARSRRSRFVELDGLRGLAALGVVLAHYVTLANTFFPHLRQIPIDIEALTLGVHLFFLISGFVIFMTVRRVRSAREFLIARATRLFPPFWVALVITTAIGYASREAWLKPGMVQFVANLTMAPKLLGQKPVDGVYWTLAVEWVFYLAMAALTAFGLLRRERVTLGILTAWGALSALLAAVLAAWRAAGSGLADVLLTATVAEYAPLFATGALLFHSREHGRPDARLALTIPAALIAGGVVQGWAHAAVLTAPIALFTVVALRERTGWLRWAPLQFLGTISYSWYLLHQNIGYALISITQDRLLGMVLGLVVTLALAWVLHEAVEVRLTRWLRPRLTPARG